MKTRSNLTDRAKRYRAEKSITQPSRRCIYCGAPRPRDIDHVDGNEANDNPANLAYSCRPCNTSKGIVFARMGLGRRTAQFNPTRPVTGAHNLAQWVTAVMGIKGQGPMSVRDAVAMIHATPIEDRSRFADEIWQRRRARGTDQAVPF